MAGAADTNLNYHILDLRENVCREELVYSIGGYGEKLLINHYTNALLALAEAECCAKLYLIAEALLLNESLELFNYLAGALKMARATNANCDLPNYESPFFVFILI